MHVGKICAFNRLFEVIVLADGRTYGEQDTSGVGCKSERVRYDVERRRIDNDIIIERREFCEEISHRLRAEKLGRIGRYFSGSQKIEIRSDFFLESYVKYRLAYEDRGKSAHVARGKKLVLNLGYSHQVIIPESNGIKIDVPQPNQIVVSGIDKQAVGQFACEIREKRPPEPYKGKGIRYTGEYIIRKEGKAGKGAKK